MNNEQNLQTLARAIRLSQGEFSLILLRCNYAVLQQRIVESLQQISPVNIRETTLPDSVTTLYTTLFTEVQDSQPDALMVFGLDSVQNLDIILTSANQVREEFRKNFPFPLLLWVNDQVIEKFIRLATDLESWATTIEFTIDNDELIAILRQITDDVFTGNFQPKTQKCRELAFARKDLQLQGQTLDAADQASLNFVLGLRNYLDNKIDIALELYQQSLSYWLQSENLLRQGIVLLNIGLAYAQKAEQNHAENQRWQILSQTNLQQSLDIFEQAQRPDLVAKYINKLGEVLRSLQSWSELQVLAKKSLNLHQIYGNKLLLAQAYGFLAEAALEQSSFDEANKLARQALKTLPQIPNIESHYRDWYRFLLARSQQQAGYTKQAIFRLEKIRKQSQLQYNPQLYITVLETLRELYFAQGEYLTAFRIKQEKISLEHQFSFRAFVGAAYLHPKRYNIDSEVVKQAQQLIVTQEIAASGRQKDVNNLIERLSRNDHKLIVIHGQSGVGKSSIIKAGLIPALLNQAIGERDALPVFVRVYTDWLGSIVRHIFPKENISSEFCTSHIIDKLQENIDRNLLTVLIFDQFEEFFFTYPDIAQRHQFYNFLRECLDIPFVKVILSLREDYLHYLLELERLGNLTTINNNILDKNIRYHLGNFTPEEAKAVVQSLTERASFYLEPELIDELVENLTSQNREVSPIELQILGAQLQTEKITTLEKYCQLGTKEKLIERFLEQVIKDCGTENENCARLVLYLLTNENGTRPFKTRDELLADLKALDLTPEIAKLEMVLEVLVGSGLVFEIPEVPADFYQLVHDYLVSFIRQQQAAKLLAELEAAKEKQKLTEEQLRQALQEKEKALRLEQQQRLRAEIAEIEALISLSQTLFLSHDQLGALVAAVKAGSQLQETKVPSWIQEKATDRIRQVVTQVKERNRFEGNSNWVTNVGVCFDGTTIATANANKTVRLWNPNGKLLSVLQGHRDVVWDVCFSPDGRILASASGDSTIKLWSRNGSLVQTFLGHSDSVFSINFHRSGHFIVSASADRTIRFWNLKGTLLKTIDAHNDDVFSVCYSPDGTIVASASADKTIKLWSLDIRNWDKNSLLLKTLSSHTDGVNSVIFSPDGKTIISAGDDRSIKYWDIKGNLQKTIPQAHTASINKLSVSHDGKIASASSDNTVKLWNRDGRLITTYYGHTDAVYGVTFTPDRNYIISCSADKTVRIWSRQGTKPLSLELKDLVQCGCEWLSDYLENNKRELGVRS